LRVNIKKMAKKEIQKDLKKAIKKTLGVELKEIHLEHPENSEHGDYSSNFAMTNFKKQSASWRKKAKSPFELAKKIVSNFPKTNYLKKIEPVSPGFVNFYLSNKFLGLQINQVLKEKNNFGAKNLGKNKKAIVEFGQPNTHKLPHVGHFRSYAIGESIARLFEFTGYNVFRANYQGDVGLQVAKCLWAYLKKKIKQKKDLKENIKDLQKAYAFGSKMYSENETAKKEIDILNIKIYNQDKNIFNLWEKTRKWSLDYYALMNKRLNTKYHRQYFESEAAKEGKKIVLENLNKVFKKSKGAIVFPGEKYGLHTRVFITSNGNPAYEAKDLALMLLKKKDFDYDISLVSTASEQSEYFKVVYKAAEFIYPKLAKKFIHIPFGMISLTGAKLSSRKGSIVSIDELLEKTKESLVLLMKQKKYSQKQINEIVDVLTIGAAKYSILKNKPIKDMIFNIKESVALQGNSGPYLQYTHARAQSILRKSKIKKIKKINGTSLNNEKETMLLRMFIKFPEIIENAAKNYSPNLICNFLFELAQNFNNFYESLPVLKARDKELKNTRLGLVKATAQIIKNGLYLLGIQAPEKM